jgi:hypothetical protein
MAGVVVAGAFMGFAFAGAAPVPKADMWADDCVGSAAGASGSGSLKVPSSFLMVSDVPLAYWILCIQISYLLTKNWE